MHYNTGGNLLLEDMETFFSAMAIELPNEFSLILIFTLKI